MAHGMSGISLFAAIAFLILHFSKIKGVDAYRILVLILLFSMALGIHGISHLVLEKEYKYNPLNV